MCFWMSLIVFISRLMTKKLLQQGLPKKPELVHSHHHLAASNHNITGPKPTRAATSNQMRRGYSDFHLGRANNCLDLLEGGPRKPYKKWRDMGSTDLQMVEKKRVTGVGYNPYKWSEILITGFWCPPCTIKSKVMASRSKR